jgi:hypothetical protein
MAKSFQAFSQKLWSIWPKVVKHLAKSCKAFGHVCMALIKLGKAQVFGVDTIIFLQL